MKYFRLLIAELLMTLTLKVLPTSKEKKRFSIFIMQYYKWKIVNKP
jgi:hypothetical protein